MALYITPWVQDGEGNSTPDGVEGAHSWSAFDLRPPGSATGDALVATDAPVAALAGRETTKAAARARIDATLPQWAGQAINVRGEVL